MQGTEIKISKKYRTTVAMQFSREKRVFKINGVIRLDTHLKEHKVIFLPDTIYKIYSRWT